MPENHSTTIPDTTNSLDVLLHNKKLEIRLAHRLYSRNYRIAHPEKIKATKKRYTVKNREKILAYQRAYARRWRVENPEKQKVRHRRDYLQAKRHNPEKVREYFRRWKARKRGTAISDFTVAQWQAMQEAYGHRCVYCGKRRKGKLTKDHITPVSKGGNDTMSNIVPACKQCNSRKQAGPILKPVQPLLLVVERKGI